MLYILFFILALILFVVILLFPFINRFREFIYLLLVVVVIIGCIFLIIKLIYKIENSFYSENELIDVINIAPIHDLNKGDSKNKSLYINISSYGEYLYKEKKDETKYILRKLPYGVNIYENEITEGAPKIEKYIKHVYPKGFFYKILVFKFYEYTQDVEYHIFLPKDKNK